MKDMRLVMGTGAGMPSTDEILQLIAEYGVKPRLNFGSYHEHKSA